MTVLQTFLFTPANHHRKVEKALQSTADAIIIDLEDACAIDEKERARKDVVEFLKKPRVPKAYVRVNAISTPFFYDDMNEVVSSRLDGIILPMVETAEDLIIADWLLASLEKKLDLPERSIDLIPIIETAKAISNLKEILKHKKRVKRIAFGAGDLTNDTGIFWSKTGEELLAIRTNVVIESRAAGLEGPIDTVYIDLADQDGLAAEAKMAKNLGFQGKMLIHPQQIDVVRRMFSPTEEEIKRAEEIVRAFKEAEASGSSSIRVGNQFVDYPIVYKAEKTLELAKRLKVKREGGL